MFGINDEFEFITAAQVTDVTSGEVLTSEDAVYDDEGFDIGGRDALGLDREHHRKLAIELRNFLSPLSDVVEDPK